MFLFALLLCFFVFVFGGSVLELFQTWEFVFVRAKDFKAFLRCSCVHLFFAFAITVLQFFFFFCKENKSVFQKEACY